jgi:hypothetical protein
MLREIVSRIALLAPYLEPCYRTSETASFLCVSTALDPRDVSGRRIHDGLTLVSGWFYRWRDRLTSLSEKPKREDVVWLVEELDRVLFLTSLFGGELAERASARSLGESDRKILLSATHRYNRFLMDYERVWNSPASRPREVAEWPTLPSEPYYERVAALESGQTH